jgi:hypothetical protein
MFGLQRYSVYTFLFCELSSATNSGKGFPDSSLACFNTVIAVLGWVAAFRAVVLFCLVLRALATSMNQLLNEANTLCSMSQAIFACVSRRHGGPDSKRERGFGSLLFLTRVITLHEMA